MNTENKMNMSRRSFLGKSMAGAAGFAILPTLSAMKMAPSDVINLGVIGLGRQSVYLLNGFLSIPGIRVVAGSDVYGIKNRRFEQRVMDHNFQATKKRTKVRTYERYQDLLAQKDVDAVLIITPDHWHALQAIDACKAGKDVYLEKPTTLTIKEGQELVKAVRQNKRILGVGSQQRSGTEFQRAVRLVHEGRIGKLERINACVGPHPTPYDAPAEPVPADLNWDLWLGPNPYVHYNHVLNPPISLDPPENEKYWARWRYYKETGGGFTTDWGAHMFDIAQWAMKMDNSGPSRIIPAGYQDHKYLTFEYANGLVMTERPWDNNETKGVKFWGSDGWVEVARGYINASDKSLLAGIGEAESGPYETKIPHLVNFIDALRAKKDPIVPVETGHKTCVTCTLGNIAHELKRPVRWDPVKEQFINDAEASKYLHRQYRDGYRLPTI
jgi:predicted dehydrogenase